MNKIVLKSPLKKRKIVLALCAILSLFIFESIFAIIHWQRSYVQTVWEDHKKKCITIAAAVYDYSFGRDSEHAYLEYCKFEASDNGEKYYQLMELRTQRQNISMFTTIYFANKLNKANIQFSNNYDNSVTYWPDAPQSILEVKIRNRKKIAIVSLAWYMDRNYKNVRYIRISGKWAVDPPYPGDVINDVVYKIDLPNKPELKSNTLSINTKVAKNDTVKVFNESEAIVIKGADLGANIKVYNASGVEINNSVITNNDVIKIKVPTKQIYIVQIGKSRYKVAL